MKNLRLPTIVVAALALVATAMAAPEEPAADAKPWRDIATGANSAIEEPSQVVIRDSEAWAGWWKKHTANQFDPENPNRPPQIDFDKETILVATLGMRTSGGFSIRFAAIAKEGDTLKVTLKATSPGPDDFVTTALTYPFAIIAIPKHDGPVEFVVE